MTRYASWQLLSKGSAEEFVDALRREALEHPAVHHPYLRRLAAGDFPNLPWAIRDYAYQYSFYGQDFPNYLEGVIGGLENLHHREMIRENLEEEKGDPHSDDPDRMPHTRLFQIFRRAAGVTPEFEAQSHPCTTVLVWRDLFLQKCQSRQPGVALGGIGMGTELVVPTIYSYIQRGIREHTSINDRDSYFFELHARCDDKHAHVLMDITKELAADRRDTREAIRFGVNSALNLRCAVWDVMMARAIDVDRDEKVEP